MSTAQDSGGPGQISSVRLTTAAWRWAVIKSDLPASSKHLALTLSTLMDPDGSIPRKYWPGIRRLSTYLARRRETVMKAVKQLVRDGWLDVREGAGTRPNEYLAAVHLSVTQADATAFALSELAVPLSGLSGTERSNQPARQHSPAHIDSLNPSECDHSVEDEEGYCTKCKTERQERQT